MGLSAPNQIGARMGDRRGALPRLPLEGPRDIFGQMKGCLGSEPGVQDEKDDRHNDDAGYRACSKTCDNGQAIIGGGPATGHSSYDATGEHGAEEMAKGAREAMKEGLEDVEDHVSDSQSGFSGHRLFLFLSSGGIRYGQFQGVEYEETGASGFGSGWLSGPFSGLCQCPGWVARRGRPLSLPKLASHKMAGFAVVGAYSDRCRHCLDLARRRLLTAFGGDPAAMESQGSCEA